MRLLHAIHDFLPRHRAGSEIYAFELARAQERRGHEVHVLCAEYDPARPHGTLEWRFVDELAVTEIVNNWHFDAFAESYQPADLDRQLEHVLRATAPDVLHIHNLLNLSLNLPALAAERGVPSVATLHDYTLLCPSGGQRVHQAERHVCREIDTARCARCFPQSHFYSQMAYGRVQQAPVAGSLAARTVAALRRAAPAFTARWGRRVAQHVPVPGIGQDDIEARLAKVRDEVFHHVDLFVAPSPALGAEYRRFGLPASKLRISDYGFVPLDAVAVERPRRPLRIGFVGTLVWHKGPHVLIEAARQLPAGSFELLVWGSVDTFPDYVAELRQAADGLPVRFLGGFDRQTVAAVYSELDVVVVASLWPENSPLVIHEAFQAGVPVVGARMGGIADLVDDGVDGLLYDAFSADALAAALRSLIDDPGAVGRLAAAVPQVKSIDQDAAEWDALYREVLAAP